MKKIVSLALSAILCVSFLQPGFAKADEPVKLVDQFNDHLKEKGQEPISESELDSYLNKAVDEVIEEANKLEEKGESNYTVTIPVNNQPELLGTIELTSKVSEEDVIEEDVKKKNMVAQNIGTLALKKKNWDKEIKYQVPVFPVNWGLRNHGTFTYGKKKKGGTNIVGGVSATVDAVCTIPYSCSDSKSVDKLDPSVWRIYGKGTYNAAVKGSPVTFHGYLDIEVNGTGNVRVKRAKFGH